MARQSVVAVANEHVSIVTVCQMFGVELPDDVGTGRSRKVHCPFEEMYHSDHGASPAMRIYPDSNSAYCFSCSAYYTPVNLAAKAMDCTYQEAASRLLDRIGYKPLDLAAAWKHAKEYEPEPDKALMADALKTYCRRVALCWEQRQFEPQVAATLTRCLSILDLVKTQDDVSLWLTRCKVAMRQALHTDDPSLSEKYQVLWESMNDAERGRA